MKRQSKPIKHGITTFLKLTNAIDKRKMYINIIFIEGFCPHETGGNTTWIHMNSGDDYHVLESSLEIQRLLALV